MSTFASLSIALLRSTAQLVLARSNESPVPIRTRLADLVPAEQDEDEELEYDRRDRDGQVVAIFDLLGLDAGRNDEEGGDKEFEVLVHRARGSMMTMSDVVRREGEYKDEAGALFSSSTR
jgi:hypothetical protein